MTSSGSSAWVASFPRTLSPAWPLSLISDLMLATTAVATMSIFTTSPIFSDWQWINWNCSAFSYHLRTPYYSSWAAHLWSHWGKLSRQVASPPSRRCTTVSCCCLSCWGLFRKNSHFCWVWSSDWRHHESQALYFIVPPHFVDFRRNSPLSWHHPPHCPNDDESINSWS